MEAPVEVVEKSDFVCECARFGSCNGEPYYKEYEGKRYCVFHYPAADKVGDFARALTERLAVGDCNFGGVVFPAPVQFHGAEFAFGDSFAGAMFNADVDFSGAKFNADALFIGTTFNARAYLHTVVFDARVDFKGAVFLDIATFSGSAFGGDADFRWVKFHDLVGFCDTTFSEDAYFSSAIFSADVNFYRAKFNAVTRFGASIFSASAYFERATFAALAEFGDIKFGLAAGFVDTIFNLKATFCRTAFGGDAYFLGSSFGATVEFVDSKFGSRAYFERVAFCGKANFTRAMFNAYVSFVHVNFEVLLFKDATFYQDVVFSSLLYRESESPHLYPQNARFERPEVVTFHTVTLCPLWFVYVNPNKFNFINVKWVLGPRRELRCLRSEAWTSPANLLSMTYRSLAVNAEENHRYHEAQEFRYHSMNIRRWEKAKGFAIWTLDWWYWAASGYGERAGRAFSMLLALVAAFGVLYSIISFVPPRPATAQQPNAPPAHDTVTLDLRQAMNYSLNVLTFQRPDPKPTTFPAQELVTLEMILGPVQAALLALAVRRRFMR